MSVNNNVQVIIKQQQELKRGIQKWFNDAERESIKFFKQSFTNQGFTDNSLKRWKSRKKQVGWPILRKTDKLYDSIKVTGRGKDYFIIGSDVTYAIYHNDGTNRLPQRQFIGDSQKLELKLIDLFNKIVKNTFR